MIKDRITQRKMDRSNSRYRDSDILVERNEVLRIPAKNKVLSKRGVSY